MCFCGSSSASPRRLNELTRAGYLASRTLAANSHYVRCYPETHRAVKVYAAQHELSMQEVVSRAVALLVKPSSQAMDLGETKRTIDRRENSSGTSLSKNRHWHDTLDYILGSGVTRAIQAATASLSAMREFAAA